MRNDRNTNLQNDIWKLRRKIKKYVVLGYICMGVLVILAVILFVFPITGNELHDIFFGVLSIILLLLSPRIMRRDKKLNNLKSQLKELESQQEQL